LSYTLGPLVGVPEEVPVVPAAVARDRPRMKYQTIPATIIRAMIIHSHVMPPPASAAGVAGAPDPAGGEAWAKAPFIAASIKIVEIESLLSIVVLPGIEG
jgi:hypothetical protein